jgi:hypothetical protein
MQQNPNDERSSVSENLQNLKVCQICNLIWQHTSQFVIVKVSERHNLAVSKGRQTIQEGRTNLVAGLYFYLQIS